MFSVFHIINSSSIFSFTQYNFKPTFNQIQCGQHAYSHLLYLLNRKTQNCDNYNDKSSEVCEYTWKWIQNYTCYQAQYNYREAINKTRMRIDWIFTILTQFINDVILKFFLLVANIRTTFYFFALFLLRLYLKSIFVRACLIFQIWGNKI